MFNITAIVFHFLGGAPFVHFLPKYVEIMFARSSESAKSVIGKPIIMINMISLFDFGEGLL